MKKMGRLAIAAVLELVGVAGIADAQTTTLNLVKQRGALSCGVNAVLAGFGQADDKGNWVGFDVDYCKAIAAAIFGDATKVKYVATTNQQRFNPLQSGESDVLIHNSTWNITRDSSLGLIFTGVNYYDGQGFLVKVSRGAKSAKELDGATVCVGSGTTTELNLADYFKGNNMTNKLLVFEKLDETVQAYLAGRCDVYTTDQSGLYSIRIQLPRPKDHVVLPEIISKEPLGPFVRQGDDQWLTIVRWVHFALINAEELGITQGNVDQMASSTNPEIKRFLGMDGDLGKGLGLENDFAAKVVKAVGNYGEVFERNVGSGSRLKIARGLNNLWNKGGIQYAPPFR
jgi:general L-amino acid transport system substrate-binding protein